MGNIAWLRRISKYSGLLAGIILAILALCLPTSSDFTVASRNMLAIAVLMAVWWMTEAVPLAVTALMPLALYPFLGIMKTSQVAPNYANHLIFLFMGGFMIALAMERWALHKRIALNVLRAAGSKPSHLIAGFMIATAFLSMWVSNTATAVMMLPIGLSVVTIIKTANEKSFQTALLLGIAYSASLGGIATLIGTPPNALLAGFMSETMGREIGFGEWMQVGLPLSFVMLILCWILLTKILYKVDFGHEGSASDNLFQNELRSLGPMSRGEILVAIVFVLTAMSWVFRPKLASLFEASNLSDAGIALGAALLLFILPVDPKRAIFVLNWDWARRLPWAVLILFGGGLSLASAIVGSGLSDWIGQQLMGLQGLSLLLIIISITTLVVFLTEMTSNTATTAAFLPLVAALATSLDIDPLLLAAPAALAASCAFMMPVATPPNAIIFGSRMLTIAQMCRAGLWLNFAAIILITLTTYTLLGFAFGL
jgi:sodium-dependent dicarboxylate transporter 2/3/5